MYQGLSNRYIFSGKIVVSTVLHVGTGRSDTRTDAAVVKDPQGKPLIPGSSLKGALRNTVEKIAASIPNVYTCLLLKKDPPEVKCISVDEKLQKKYNEAREEAGTETQLRRVEASLSGPEYPLCDTCKFFGSLFSSSKVTVPDLPVVNWDGKSTDIRDGVGIDRDTETVAYGAKFDFECIPPGTEFKFELILENPNATDLGLLAIGLREFQLEMIPLGGNTSRGTGKCRLVLESITYVNLTNKDSLLKYLTESQPAQGERERKIAGESVPIEEIDEWISKLLQKQGREGEEDA